MAIKKRGQDVLESFHGLFLALGIVLLIFGVLLIIFPIIGTFAVELLLGVTLLVTGIVGIVVGAVSRKWKGSTFVILNGIISTIVGFMLLFYPGSGVMALTLFIGIFMLVQGIFEMAKSSQVREKFWKRALLINGIFSFLLGFLVLIGWPADSVWLIGLFLGISLVFGGVAAIGLANSVN